MTDATIRLTTAQAIIRYLDAQFIEIDVICSDQHEHKQRIETRVADISELQLPTLDNVAERDYHQWVTERIVIDTAGRTLEQSKRDLMDALGLSLSKA